LRRRPLAASAAVLLAAPLLGAQQAPAPATSAAAGGGPTSAARVQYPATRRVDQVDDYHGTKVADPFRWLEDLDGPETPAGCRRRTRHRRLPRRHAGRDAIRDRLTAMWNYPRVSLPWREGGRLFFTKNTGLQKQSPYYTTRGAPRPTPSGAALVLDPNAISKDGSTSLSMFAPDPTAPTWPTG
jgi:prolyl oligopeptidase